METQHSSPKRADEEADACEATGGDVEVIGMAKAIAVHPPHLSRTSNAIDVANSGITPQTVPR